MTQEEKIEICHRIVGCMIPGRIDLALEAIRDVERDTARTCAEIAESSDSVEGDWVALEIRQQLRLDGEGK